MRLALFESAGRPRLGVVDCDDVVDVTELMCAEPKPGPAGPLQWLLDRGGLADLGHFDLAGRARMPLRHTRLGPPLPRPGKIIAAPVNYRDHQVEMEAPLTIADLGMFLKAPSSVIGPAGRVFLPYSDVRTDQEAELAVVIGRTARDVPAQAALDYVAGYTCLFDITVRSTEDRSTRKSFDTFTPLGPWLVTPDEVGDPGWLQLRCWVNGELRQSASTADLIFGVPELIAYASSVMTLWPGDVIATGTPAGVGPIAPGDSVVMEIERVGRLEVSVSGERAQPYQSRPGALSVSMDGAS